ncbi:MAG: DUF5916 domain-containing protein [Rubricoccaceae bacterium]
MRLLLPCFLLASLAAAAHAQSPLPPAIADTVPGGPGQARYAYAAVTIAPGEITLDGRLDEPAWQRARAATGFVQLRPAPGQPGSEKTEARVLVDGRHLYVGMRMHDRQAEAIQGRLARRDARVESDWAGVSIDSYMDRRTAFAFMVNAAGVKRDELLFNDTNQSRSWDAVWDVAVSRDDGGWTAEFRIPLSQLRFAAGTDTWGLQFSRTIARTGEELYWSPLLPEHAGVVSRFGTISGMGELRPGRRAEVVPYLAGRLARLPGDDADPFHTPTEAVPRAGLDLQLGLTGDLTFTGTVNPDFGQVEADPAQVNLSAFEPSFQERRPFFVEGADVFSFGRVRSHISTGRPNYLYTRRIGRSPQRAAFVPGQAYEAGTVYTDAPDETTILGAAKVSGRLAGWSVGVLNAVTRAEYGRYAAVGADGRPALEGRALVEPPSNYFAARARRAAGAGQVGGLLTAVHRFTDEPALAGLLPRQAYVGGLDFERPLAGGAWIVSGVAAGSLVEGSPEAMLRLQRAPQRFYQRPDAAHLRLDPDASVLAGFAADLALQKAGGERWLGSVTLNTTSPGFDANALGFHNATDRIGLNAMVIYRQNTPTRRTRSWSANASGVTRFTYGGERTDLFFGTNLNGQFHNFWSAGLSASFWPGSYDDRLTRGGPLAAGPMGGSVTLNVSTDGRQVLSGGLSTSHSGTALGGRSHGLSVSATYRPSDSVTLALSPGASYDFSPRQYVRAFADPAATATFGRRYVFGELEQRSASVETRLDWIFTPDFSLQLALRPFVASGDYLRYSEFDAPRARALPVYGRDKGTATRNADGSVTVDPGDGGAPFRLADPSFTFRSLQGSAVLRWEYRPGSALFFVWQQQRSGFVQDGRPDWARDGRALFSDPVENVFLVKATYWLSS